MPHSIPLLQTLPSIVQSVKDKRICYDMLSVDMLIVEELVVRVSSMEEEEKEQPGRVSEMEQCLDFELLDLALV